MSDKLTSEQLDAIETVVTEYQALEQAFKVAESELDAKNVDDADIDAFADRYFKAEADLGDFVIGIVDDNPYKWMPALLAMARRALELEAENARLQKIIDLDKQIEEMWRGL